MLLTAWPTLGQEQRGSIEGTVTDVQGVALPGARVEARSPALVGRQTTYANAQGLYRFPALPPGVYMVTASLDGFMPSRVEDINLGLGLILKAHLTLELAGVEDTITVTAESPVIDIVSNAASANIKEELIDRIPKNRDFTSLVVVAPGAHQDWAAGGIQIDGASGSENRFIVDGIDTTSMVHGTSAREVRTDFVKAVQVKSSGYNAEYRAATGGVISAVTKDGGNSFHGTAGFYYDAEPLYGKVRPVVRLNPSDQSIAEKVTYEPVHFTRWEPLFDLGGPVIGDKIWFYIGLYREIYDRERTVTFNTNDETETFYDKPRATEITYNIATQATQDLRVRFSGANQRSDGSYDLPSIEPDGTSNSNPGNYPDPTRLKHFNDRYSAVIDYVASGNLYFNSTLGYLGYGMTEVGETGTSVQHVFLASNFQFPEIPSHLQQPRGYTDAIGSWRTVYDDYSRVNVNGDGTYYGHFGGDHALKGGIQWERVANQLLDGHQHPQVRLHWDAARSTLDGRRVRGEYGYFLVRQIQNRGDIAVNNTGFFIQDAWTINDRLTLNLGFRTEKEDIPSYRPENPGIHFGFADKPSPRLGFAYDLLGDGRWKVYSSWGMFYDITKLAMPQGSFGATNFVHYYYTLDHWNWPEITCGDTTPPVPLEGGGPNYPDCPGTFIEQWDLSPAANDAGNSLIDPDLKPLRTQEFSVGLDHELSQVMVASVRYTHKQLDRTIEDVGAIVPGVGQVYWIANPGFGLGEYPLGPDFPAQPPAQRDYDGIEFRLRRRFRDNWSANISYLYSRLYGNYSGLASSDEYGRTDPNFERSFDGLYMAFDAHAQPVFGRLQTDRPHVFKFQGTYDFSWGTMVGTNILWQSGRQVTERMWQRSVFFFPEGRGNMGRTPALFRMDLLVQQDFRLPRDMRLNVQVNFINLFDLETVDDVWDWPYRDGFNVSDELFFSGNWDPRATAAADPDWRYDPRFGQPGFWLDRRTIRLQARLIF
jgi:hypothetical protein